MQSMHLSVKTISIAPTLCQVCTEFWGHKNEGDLKSPEDLRDIMATRSRGARRHQMDAGENNTADVKSGCQVWVLSHLFNIFTKFWNLDAGNSQNHLLSLTKAKCLPANGTYFMPFLSKPCPTQDERLYYESERCRVIAWSPRMQLASSLRQDLDRRGHRIQFPPRLDPGIQEEAWIPGWIPGSKTGSLGAVLLPRLQDGGWYLEPQNLWDNWLLLQPPNNAPALSWTWQSTRKPSLTVSSTLDLGPGASGFNWTSAPVCKKVACPWCSDWRGNENQVGSGRRADWLERRVGRYNSNAYLQSGFKQAPRWHPVLGAKRLCRAPLTLCPRPEHQLLKWVNIYPSPPSQKRAPHLGEPLCGPVPLTRVGPLDPYHRLPGTCFPPTPGSAAAEEMFRRTA